MLAVDNLITKFGWPEIIITLLIILIITGVHEWRNVARLFSNEKKKKDNMHTQE